MDGLPRENVSDSSDSEAAGRVRTGSAVEEPVEGENDWSDNSDSAQEEDSGVVPIGQSRKNRIELEKTQQGNQVVGPMNRFIRVQNSHTARQSNSLTKEQRKEKLLCSAKELKKSFTLNEDAMKLWKGYPQRKWTIIEKYRKPKKNGSLAHHYGLHIMSDKKTRWLCMICAANASAEDKFGMKESSFLSTSMSNLTYNPTNHLREAHNIVSESKAKSIDEKVVQQTNVEVHKKNLEVNPKRARILQMARCVVRHNLPLHLVEKEEFRLNFLDCPDFLKINDKNLKKMIYEMYLALRESIMDPIKDAIRFYSAEAPFVYLYADLYTSPSMKLKFVGIRVSFNLPCEKKDTFHTYNLAVRPFYMQREQDIVEGGDKRRMSEHLYDWCEKTLHSYGLEMKNIISRTSDSGSDVKRMFTLIESASWEWCIPHIISRVCIDSFGASINKAKSKNKEARGIVDKIKKVLEKVNKGTKVKEILDELNETTERYRKMLSYAPQRWQSFGRVVDRVLENWEELREAFIKVENNWLLQDYKSTIMEFDAMLQQIGEVVRATQGRDVISALVQFYLLYTNLGPDKHLNLRVRDGMGRVMYNEFRAVSNAQLTSAGSSVKNMLRKNLEDRFFNRYSIVKGLQKPGIRYVLGCDNIKDAPISIMKKYLKFSYWFDVLILMTPVKGFYDGRLLKKMITAVPISAAEFDSLKRTMKPKPSLSLQSVQIRFHQKLYSYLKYQIRDICIRIHKNRSSDKRKQTEVQPVVVSGHSPQKRAKTTLYTNLLGLDEDSKFSATSAVCNDTREVALENVIDEELFKYFRSGLVIPEVLKKDKHFDPIPQVKRIWNSDEVKKSYPHLYVVANAILGGMASSGDLERDFNPMEDLLRGKRSSLNPALVEILMHLHLNFNMIPRKLKDIPGLSLNEIQELTPYHLTNDALNESLRKILAMGDDEIYGQCISDSDLGEELESENSSSSDEMRGCYDHN